MRMRTALVLPLLGAALVVLGVSGCTAAPPLPEQTSAAAPPSPLPSFGDRGPQQYAEGKAHRVGAHDFLYTVARGDTAGGVAARFGTTVDRVSGGSRGGLELFEGDELRFGPPPEAAAQ